MKMRKKITKKLELFITTIVIVTSPMLVHAKTNSIEDEKSILVCSEVVPEQVYDEVKKYA